MSKFEINRSRSVFAINAKVDNMGADLQSQNRVDVDYEKTTGLIYLKF